MNEEAREKAWRKWIADSNHQDALGTAFDAGWDAARTFSAEDVERGAEAIHNQMWIEYGGNMWRAWPYAHPDDAIMCRAYSSAALAAIGTVEEAQ